MALNLTSNEVVLDAGVVLQKQREGGPTGLLQYLSSSLSIVHFGFPEAGKPTKLRKPLVLWLFLNELTRFFLGQLAEFTV